MIQLKNERLTEILQMSDAEFYDRINTINTINLLNFLDKKKMSIFEEYRIFKGNIGIVCYIRYNDAQRTLLCIFADNEGPDQRAPLCSLI